MFFCHQDLLADFGILSIVLIFAHIIRSKVKVLQYIYMPSSIIAGLFCMIAGWQFYDILPFSIAPDGTPNFASYPAFLVVILFSTLFLGKSEKSIPINKTLEHAKNKYTLIANVWKVFSILLEYCCKSNYSLMI